MIDRKLTVWIIKTGEAVIGDKSQPRLYRATKLADIMSSRGHDVTYWSATFDHSTKSLRDNKTFTRKLGENWKCIFMHAGTYTEHVSLKRIHHHRQLARKFRAKSKTVPRPDVILCCMPTIEFAYAAVKFGRENSVPVIIDIRDFWPDLIANKLSRLTYFVASPIISRMVSALGNAVTGSTAITGVGERAVTWGLSKGERRRNPLDRAFASGYSRPEITSDDRRVAADYWRRHDVVFDGTKTIISACGSLNEGLGYETLIKGATAIPADRRDKIQLVICGSGAVYDKLVTMTQNAGLGNVILPGQVHGQSLPVLLDNSDMAILPYPSRFDLKMVAPNKFGEYLAYGLPVLAAPEGEVRNLIEEHQAGLSYDINRPEQLAEIALKLIDDDELRRKMSANAEALYHRSFDAERIYREFADHIETVAEAGPLNQQGNYPSSKTVEDERLTA